ncbi:MAG: sigma-70 family RNA polymerase sigma factor [bacterium]
MNNCLDSKFPSEFGISPDDFLERYESLIYKVIFERTRENPKFEAEDLFHDFFIHIAEDNFRRLRCYRKECQPITYIGKVLRNFICDKYRKKDIRMSTGNIDELTEEKRETIFAEISPREDIFDSELIQDAFEETFSQLSNREKLIFDLFTDEEMTAKEIADLLQIKVKTVYKNNEKVKNILKDELKKRGVGKL